MKKKFDWDAPMSRKNYAVLYGSAFGIYMVIYAVFAVMIYEDKIKAWFSGKIKKIFKEKHSEEK